MTASTTIESKGREIKAAIAARASKASKKKSQKVVELAVVAQEKKGTTTPAQQEALIVKYRLKARKLGRSILRRWHARLDLEEVDSIVDLSLCEAVKRFDPYKGASFMTFLYYHLKGNLVRAVTTAAAAHSIPVFQIEPGEIERAEREHFIGHQLRGLNSSEVAEALTSQDVPMPDEVLWRKELHDKSAAACEKLDALEREIIKRIFIQEQQIMDIASSLGYSRCHISRVKKKALETLYGELRGAMNNEDLGQRPPFEEEQEEEHGQEVQLRLVDRRPVHRRRPRSKVARTERVLAAKAA
jgi:RNA polymerase sigma factor (sigma-70 family)